MPAIQFPASTAPGVNFTESGGRLINALCVDAPPGSRSQLLWRRVAGLRPIELTTGADDARGNIKLGSQLVSVNGDTAYLTSKSGSVYSPAAQTGTVGGSGPVIMARNNRATPQVFIVHSDGAQYLESGTVADITDPDLPQPVSVTTLDGFGVFAIADGRMFATALNDFTIDANDYTTAEAKPDGLVRAVAAGRDLLAFGNGSLEFYGNAGQETGFPFSRSAVIPVGLKGKYAVAGFDEGWTGPVGFVASDNTVRIISGYDAAVISNEDLQKLIEAVTDTDDLRMTAYVSRGVAYLSLTYLEQWTWEFNTARGRWHERQSYGRLDWRGQFAVNAFDEWLVSDDESADFFRLDSTFKREGVNQLIWEVRSIQAHGFPGRAAVHRADFDFQTGVGVDIGADPIETDPKVEVSWSDDGGVTFSAPELCRLGSQGERLPVTVRRTGITSRNGRQWRLRVADPVDVALYGGAMDAEARAA